MWSVTRHQTVRRICFGQSSVICDCECCVCALQECRWIHRPGGAESDAGVNRRDHHRGRHRGAHEGRRQEQRRQDRLRRWEAWGGGKCVLRWIFCWVWCLWLDRVLGIHERSGVIPNPLPHGLLLSDTDPERNNRTTLIWSNFAAELFCFCIVVNTVCNYFCCPCVHILCKCLQMTYIFYRSLIVKRFGCLKYQQCVCFWQNPVCEWPRLVYKCYDTEPDDVSRATKGKRTLLDPVCEHVLMCCFYIWFCMFKIPSGLPPFVHRRDAFRYKWPEMCDCLIKKTRSSKQQSSCQFIKTVYGID